MPGSGNNSCRPGFVRDNPTEVRVAVQPSAATNPKRVELARVDPRRAESMKVISFVAIAALCAPALAQNLQFSATTNSPVVLLAATAGGTNSAVFSLAQESNTAGAAAVETGPGLARATATWSTTMDSDMSKRCSYRIDSLVNGTPSSTTIPLHEVVVELTATAPRDVTLTYSFSSASNTGSVLFEVDMGDTGTFSPAANGLTLQRTLDTQPYRIRIRAQSFTPGSATQQFATSIGSFDLEVTPDNNLAITQAVAGCGTEATVGPVFTSTGIGIRAQNNNVPFNAPMVAVLGLQAQPAVLPNLSPSQLPCLLYPQPDALIAFAPTPIGSTSTTSGYSLPIPAAVRPFSFFAQVVRVAGPTDLRTSDAYLINAF